MEENKVEKKKTASKSKREYRDVMTIDFVRGKDDDIVKFIEEEIVKDPELTPGKIVLDALAELKLKTEEKENG